MIMEKYETIKVFLTTFLGNDADAYGENYPEIVDAATELVTGLKSDLQNEASEFIREFSNNETARLYLNNLTQGDIGDVSFLRPSPLEFVSWLAIYLKEKESE